MCTKARFASRPLALQRVVEIKTHGEVRDKNPVRAYYCGICGGYHLTSQPLPKEKANIIKKRKEAMPERVAEHWVKKMNW